MVDHQEYSGDHPEYNAECSLRLMVSVVHLGAIMEYIGEYL